MDPTRYPRHNIGSSRDLKRRKTEGKADSMSPAGGSSIGEDSISKHAPSTRSPFSQEKPRFVSFANTSELLKHLSRRVIEILNDRDFSSPFLNCLADEMVADSSHIGKKQVLRDFQKMVERYPKYRAEIQNVTCSVEEASGRAVVVMTSKISGYQFDTVRQAATLFTWSRRRDQWTCISWELVRMIEEFD